MARANQFTANAQLAAMSQRAAQLMTQRGMAATPQGQTIQMPQYAKSLLSPNRVNQMAGTRTSQSLTEALKIPTMKAPSRDQIYAMAQARAASAASAASGPGDMADFSRHNTQFAGQLGMSDEDAYAAALRYAQGRSYGGGGYVPHNIAQEGHVEYRNGVPGVYVKYSTGGGSSTEWTPLK